MVKVLRFSLFYFAFALSLSGFAHSIRPACNVTKSPLSHLGITNADAAVYAKMSERPHYHFFVWLKDGRYDAYAFDAKPKIYYEDGDLIVASDEGVYRYANEDVRKITLSDNEMPIPTGINAVPADRVQGNTMRRSGDEVRMQGMRPGGKLYVYSADGKLQKVLSASAEGCLTVRLSEFAKGTYILKTETTTYKIIKK